MTALDDLAVAHQDRRRRTELYPIDGALPSTAYYPRSREEVAALLAAAASAGLVVVPQGGRSAMGLGRPLERYDFALDSGGLDHIVAYEPDDLTITVEAGVTLKRVQALLAERGQYLSVDPPPDDRVTIGGMLATARPGAWREHVPGVRDLVLGVQVALPDGTLVRSGGRVVKNVSGYDLHRLHTGALGAFGVIVEASFKLAPLPTATRSFAVRCPGFAEAEALAFDVRGRALSSRALALLPPAAAKAAGLPAGPHVLVEFAGVEAAVERSGDEVRNAAAGCGADATESSDREWERLRALAGSSDGVVLRIGVPASEVRTAVEASEAAGCTAWGHLAAGSVIVCAPSMEPETVRSLRAHAREAGGFLQIESAPAALRSEVDPFDSGEVELVRALKRQFDPHGTLNRGRWMAGV